MKIKSLFNNRLIITLRALMVVVLLGLTAQCTTDESFAEPEASDDALAEESVSAAARSASLTVSGAFIEYAEGSSLCSECSYILPEDATVVDGKVVGIKPGDVICLNSAFSYGSIELVNVDGSEESPIIIANCGE